MLLCALAVPVLASGKIYSIADDWYYVADDCYVLTVKDNKNTFTYHLAAGVNFIGSQRDFVGQLLQVVDLIPHAKCDRCGECLICSKCICDPEGASYIIMITVVEWDWEYGEYRLKRNNH